MDPSRKRKVRLVVALGAAVLLAGALLYTSFGTATAAESPSQLLSAHNNDSKTYQLTGTVVNGSIEHQGGALLFRVRDRAGTTSVPVSYEGIVPDPFRDGREVIVNGRLEHGTFMGQRDSLVTKCPSKFQGTTNGKTL